MNDTGKPKPTAGPPAAVIGAVRRLLRPLVRLLLSQEITYPMLANLLKSLYVEIAANEFRLKDRPQTDSRITLLTGVHRKEVKRLLHEEPQLVTEPPAAVSLGAQLIARWTGLPEYLDAGGRPRPLPRLSGADGEASFETLVRSVSTDIRPRSVLDEWLRLGIARVDDEDRVVLVSEAFVPRQGLEEKAFYLGHNLHDHLAAAVHNLIEDAPPFLERSVYYEGLAPESVQQLAEQSRTLGMEVLHAINRQAQASERRGTGGSDAARRFTFGVYFYSEPQERGVDGSHPGEGTDVR